MVPTPESARRQPETQVEHTRRFKRKAETDREQLEREIREDSEELLQTNMDFDWFWVGSGEPVLVASLGTLEGPASFAPATSPEIRQHLLKCFLVLLILFVSIEAMSMIL